MLSPIVILQIPNEAETDSATYELDLQDDKHTSWLDCLENSRRLRNYMDMEQHIVYYPETGAFETIADLDAPSPEQEFLRIARLQNDSKSMTSRDRWEAQARRRQAPGVSRLRTFLGDRRGLI